MNHSIKDVIKLFEIVKSKLESTSFNNRDTYDEVQSIIEDIKPYLNLVALSFVDKVELENLHILLSRINEIFNEDVSYPINFPLKYEDLLENNLNEIRNKLENVGEIKDFMGMNARLNSAINQIKNEIRTQAQQQFGEAAISSLDYEFKKEYEKQEIALQTNETLFIKSLIISFISFMLISWLDLSENIIGSILKRFYLSIPFLLLLFYFLSKIKENRIMMQIYLYKKVLARSYLNYAYSLSTNYFGSNNEVGKEMAKLLLQTTIDALKDNPVDYLTKSRNNDDAEIQEIIGKLIDKIPDGKEKE
jgi:hypothetical protein